MKNLKTISWIAVILLSTVLPLSASAKGFSFENLTSASVGEPMRPYPTIAGKMLVAQEKIKFACTYATYEGKDVLKKYSKSFTLTMFGERLRGTNSTSIIEGNFTVPNTQDSNEPMPIVSVRYRRLFNTLLAPVDENLDVGLQLNPSTPAIVVSGMANINLVITSDNAESIKLRGPGFSVGLQGQMKLGCVEIDRAEKRESFWH